MTSQLFMCCHQSAGWPDGIIKSSPISPKVAPRSRHNSFYFKFITIECKRRQKVLLTKIILKWNNTTFRFRFRDGAAFASCKCCQKISIWFLNLRFRFLDFSRKPLTFCSENFQNIEEKCIKSQLVNGSKMQWAVGSKVASDARGPYSEPQIKYIWYAESSALSG